MNRMYFFSVAAILALGMTANANQLDKDGIMRDDNGEVLTVNRDEAQCPEGTHIPTIRELATDSMKYGAPGILEKCKSKRDSDCLPEGHPAPDGYFWSYEYAQVADNEDGSKEPGFFYNGRGYSPEGELANNSFWSSTVGESNEPKMPTQYIFNGYNTWGDARILEVYTPSTVALRCFPNR